MRGFDLGIWVMSVVHRTFRGHWPDWVLLEVVIRRGETHRQYECLACDRRPGPGGRIPLLRGV